MICVIYDELRLVQLESRIPNPEVGWVGAQRRVSTLRSLSISSRSAVLGSI